jgi:transcriptional regulator with XRE-family HTH domain
VTTLQEHIGGNVKALRGNTSPREFGEALALWLGKPWTRQAVWEAEHGKRAFTAAELLALAAALDVTLPQLFECTDNVSLPSGKTMPGTVIEALTVGTNNERDRTLRILASARALKRAHRELTGFVLGLGQEVSELERDAHGAPQRVATFDSRGTVFDAVDQLGQAVSEGWRRPPKAHNPDEQAALQVLFESGDSHE